MSEVWGTELSLQRDYESRALVGDWGFAPSDKPTSLDFSYFIFKISKARYMLLTVGNTAE
jgi:hypothetical protein